MYHNKWGVSMRLIDADAFIEELGLDAENSRENNIGEIVTAECFDRQETAYDIDNVIDSLNKELDNACERKKLCIKEDSIQFTKGYVQGIEEAIRIVKSGYEVNVV